MINGHVAVGADGTTISRRFGLAPQGHPKGPLKSDPKENRHQRWVLFGPSGSRHVTMLVW
jgi:hypothetical protein